MLCYGKVIGVDCCGVVLLFDWCVCFRVDVFDDVCGEFVFVGVFFEVGWCEVVY